LYTQYLILTKNKAFLRFFSKTIIGRFEHGFMTNPFLFSQAYRSFNQLRHGKHMWKEPYLVNTTQVIASPLHNPKQTP
jgi:hypothetical protein